MVAPLAAAARADALAQLARHCHDHAWGRGVQHSLASGFAALDAQLPGGGWPLGAIVELMSDAAGLGELRLVMPTLVRLARAGRQVVWIAPPHLPYAPALRQQGLPLERLWVVQISQQHDMLWAFEQALRCPAVGAVLGWATHIVDRNIRRLQLAAEAGGSLGLLYRPAEAAAQSSPAALRLRIHAAAGGAAIELWKIRGSRSGRTLPLRNLDEAAQTLRPSSEWRNEAEPARQ